LSTFDFSIPDGGHIPVEERSPEEVTQLSGREVAPAAAPTLKLAFDVTPNELISGIITEAGIAAPPYASSLKPWKQSRLGPGLTIKP
jgi:methylthioribose-1-phosphate isomerase